LRQAVLILRVDQFIELRFAPYVMYSCGDVFSLFLDICYVQMYVQW